MFFAWLVAAGFQLVCAAGVFAMARTRTVWGVVVATLAGLFGVLLLAASPLLFLQGLVLAAIGIACTCAKARQHVFAAWATAATVAVLGLAGWVGVHSWWGLRERYPFESISSRLAYEKRAGTQDGLGRSPTPLLSSPTLREDTLSRLDKTEERRGWNGRGKALRLVHASYVEQFIESPGFGVGRMIRPSPSAIAFGDKRAGALYKLGRRPYSAGSPELSSEYLAEEGERSPPPSLLGPLDTLHNEARRDFLDPEGFGYFRDRDHVAGFVSHGFLNCQPSLFTSRRRWLTVRVDLVSLLKHERPMAYVSDHLPNMAELRDAPVRELDAFEQRALGSLIKGEDLVADWRGDRIRAVGSLRATKQCLDCHQVERGGLLGAFSYEFLRDPPAPRLQHSDPEVGEKLL